MEGRRPIGPEPNGKRESGHTNEAQPGERETERQRERKRGKQARE